MPCVPIQEERTQNAAFNPRHAQYACCFQHLHANTGSLLISVFHIIIYSAVLALIIHTIDNPKRSTLELVFELTLLTTCLVSSLILLIGLKMENRRMISAYIMTQSIAVSLLFMLFLALIMGLKAGILDDPDHNGYNTLEEELLIVVEIFASLAVVGVEVWFLTIVLKSYRYFTDKYHYMGPDHPEDL